MKRKLKAGSTSQMMEIVVKDTSSDVGANLTGLAFNTAGLTWYYHRQGASSAVAVTLATATLGTWTSGGFVAVDGTNMPGHYELGIPNAALASGASWVTLLLKGATNMPPISIEIELDAVDYQDAAGFGLSRLDATIGSRATQASLDTVDDFLDTEIAAIKAKTDNLPSDPADASDIAAAFSTVNSTLATLATYVDTEVVAIKAKTDLIPAGGFPTNFASMVISAGGLVSINLAQTGLTPRDLSAVADAALTVGDALVSSISEMAGDETIVSTAYTKKTPAGTTVRVFTLDSATSPTSRT